MQTTLKPANPITVVATASSTGPRSKGRSSSPMPVASAGVAAIQPAAIQAFCESQLLVGQQAAAFTAAALPLCRRV
ncbi:hypothetical protein [Brachybacterium hainanense]|uniref:Uncharacterized protein n=1 Tax=Brachybacterium hainanense TaxID=1541174 RepID=A0ABV6RBT9_9MICO